MQSIQRIPKIKNPVLAPNGQNPDSKPVIALPEKRVMARTSFRSRLMIVLAGCLLLLNTAKSQDSLKISGRDFTQIDDLSTRYGQETNDIGQSARNQNIRGSGYNFTPQTNFDPAAIVTCGKFRVYYEDINQHNGIGYDAPSGLGAVRCSTFCAVLTYIQNTLDLTQVNGTTDFVDIYMELSTTNITTQTTYLARAFPYFQPGTYGTVAGFYNGHVFDHITTGNDPQPNFYDGHIETNFNSYYDATSNSFIPIGYWNDYQNPTVTCQFDLYSVLLHEMTHTLGFASSVGESTSSGFPAICTNSANSFMRFDDLFLYSGDPCTGNFTKFVTSAPAISNLLPNLPCRTLSVWLTNTGAPQNQPIYSGSLDPYYPMMPGSFMSHLAGTILSYTAMSQFSPGYQSNYVMGPGIGLAQRKREWTIPELRILLRLGYGLDPNFSTATNLVLPGGNVDNGTLLMNNTPPYRTNCATPELSYFGAPNFMETMAQDFALTNDNTPSNLNTSFTTINVGQLAYVNDLETGTQLYVAPNSLFGIRGVSSTGQNNGGNNHNCLQLISTANNGLIDQIKYTPLPGFHGRAQFGFYLSDQNERGALRIVTIDVTPGTAYTLNPGDQMVIYPDLEDGTEIRQRILSPNTEHTQVEDWAYEGIWGGRNMSGGHYFNWLTNNWNLGGGDIVENNWYACFMGIDPKNGYYGSSTADWNSPHMGLAYPTPVVMSSDNQRYHNFEGDRNYSSLINQIGDCNVYHFECDLNFEKTGFTVGQTFQFELQFVDNPFPNYHTQLYYTAPVQVTISTVAPNTWQHVTFDFQYCGTPTYFMNLLVEGIVTPQLVVTGSGNTNPNGLNKVFTPAYYSAIHCPFIDNITLKQITPTPPPVTLSASANPTTVCSGGTSSFSVVPVNYLPCNATYTWNPGNLSGNNVTSGPIMSTTTFTATVNYACNQTSNATVTVTANPLPTITFGTNGPYCLGQGCQTLNVSPSGGTWSGPGVSGNTFCPAVTGNGTFTLTYSYTNPSTGCSNSAQTSVIVGPPASSSITQIGPFCSSNSTPQLLTATPSGGSFSGTGVSFSSGNYYFTPSVAGAGNWTITYSGSCISVSTMTVVVTSPATVTITPVGPLCQYDPVQTLTVNQGTGTFSGPGVTGNQFNPATANIGNNTITWNGTVGACTATATMTIVVNPGVGPAGWPKFVTSPGTGTRSWFNSVVTDAQGNVYATGFLGGNSTVPSFGNFNGDYIFVVKYNEQCGGVWINTVPAVLPSEGLDVTLDNNGDVLVTGLFTGTNVNFGNSQQLTSQPGSTESFLWKINKTSGATIYAKQSTSPVTSTPSAAAGRAIRYDAVNNAIYVTGDFTNTVKFGTLANLTTTGDRDVFVTRYNGSTGAEMWSVKIGSSFVGKPDVAGGIGTDASGNVYVGCSVSGSVVFPVAATNTTPGTTDLFLVKLTAASGAYAGANAIRGNSTDDVFLRDLFVDNTGRCYITGSYKGALTLGTALATATTQDIYVGFTSSTLSFTSTWSYACGSSNANSTAETGTSITVYNNDVYVTGTAYGGATFTGFTPSTISTTSNAHEAFVIRILNGGTRDYLRNSVTANCTVKTSGRGIAVSPLSGSVFSGGIFQSWSQSPCSGPQTVTFNGPALTYQGGEHAWISRNNSSSWFRYGGEEEADETQSAAPVLSEQVSLFPNPNAGEFTLVFRDGIPANCQIRVTDATGRVLDREAFSYEFNANSAAVHIPGAPNGLYFVEIISDNGVITKKVVLNR